MRTRSPFRPAGIALFGLVLLAIPSAAAAREPLIEEFDIVEDNSVFASCGDFLMIANGAGRVRITTFFNREGDPIRVLFQGRYNGTITNSVTGATLYDSPSVANITIDLVKGTETQVGTFFNVTVPGVGVVFLEAGRLVFDGAGPPVFIAGPHYPPAEGLAILCDALR